MSRLFRFGPLCAAIAMLTACGSSQTECLDDRSCETGQRCEFEGGASRGVCAPCAAGETPYNGVDDDCNPRTRDSDLDGDGDNAEDAPTAPGGDCDDSDPTVASILAEVCGDAKDNDCDGTVDEPDCGDTAPPTVSFLQPMDGDPVSGQAPLRIQVNDDVGAVELVVRANNVEVGRRPLDGRPSETVDLTLSATSLADGEITLRATAIDGKGQEGTALIRVVVDNMTPPDIMLLSPVGGSVYGGDMFVDAMIDDPSGVATVEYELDAMIVGTATGAPYRFTVDTSSLTEGAHQVLVRAADTNGSVTTRRVEFSVDNTPPSLRFATPAAGAMIRNVASVVVTASDASSIAEIRSEGRSARTSPLLYDFDTAPLPNGPITLTASAADTAIVNGVPGSGNRAVVTLDVVVDNIDPTPMIAFVNPMDGDGVLGLTTHEVTVTSLLGNPITRVDFTIGGRAAGGVTAAPYRLAYDYRVETGTVAVTVTAEDDQGNVGQASIVVRVTDFPNFRVAPSRDVMGSIGQAGFTVDDIDGDGVQDVVTGGSELGVATGTIGADGEWNVLAVRTIDRRICTDVRTADLDGDLDPDLVCLGAADFRIYVNQGGGVFTPDVVTTFPQTGVTAFELADLDGDADLDMVAVGGNVPGIVGFVYRFDSGQFGFAQNLGGDAGAVDVALGDVNDDGVADVVVGRAGTNNVNVTVFVNGGSANFGAGIDTAALAPAERIAIGEVNSGPSGLPEIVATLPTVDGYQVFAVTSTQPFALATQAALVSMDEPRSLAIGQVVGDATPDIVLGSFVGNGFQVIETAAAVPSGFAVDETYIMARDLRNLQLADLDNDGDLDVVASSQQDNSIVWARNLGNGKFLASIATLAPVAIDPMTNNRITLVPRAVALGNVTGSAAPDMVVSFDRATPFDPQLGIYELQQNRFTLADIGALPTSVNPPSSVAVGGASPTSGYSYIAVSANVTPQTGMASALIIESVPPQLLSTNLALDRPASLAIGDVDGDAGSELIVALDPTGAGQDGSLVIDLDFTQVLGPFNVGEGPGSVTVANLDNDGMGQLDYAVSNFTSENVTVQLWNGAGFSTTTYNAPIGVGAITTGLVGNDALVDIVGVARNSIFVMEGDPTFGFRTPVTYAAGQNPTRLVGGDFNGDGLFDVLTLNSQDRLSLLVARPQGGFYAPVTLATGNVPSDITVGDVDGDGRPDVVITNSGVPSVMTIFNNADTL